MAATAAMTICTGRERDGSSPQWLGQCPHCKAWNTLDQAVAEPAGAAKPYRDQALHALSTQSEALYVDGEERTAHVELRARRLGLAGKLISTCGSTVNCDQHALPDAALRRRTLNGD